MPGPRQALAASRNFAGHPVTYVWGLLRGPLGRWSQRRDGVNLRAFYDASQDVDLLDAASASAETGLIFSKKCIDWGSEYGSEEPDCIL